MRQQVSDKLNVPNCFFGARISQLISARLSRVKISHWHLLEISHISENRPHQHWCVLLYSIALIWYALVLGLLSPFSSSDEGVIALSAHARKCLWNRSICCPLKIKDKALNYWTAFTKPMCCIRLLKLLARLLANWCNSIQPTVFYKIHCFCEGFNQTHCNSGNQWKDKLWTRVMLQCWRLSDELI